MPRKNRNPQIQQLESRELMAGDVAVAVSGATLEINETANTEGEDQAVQVRQLSSGKLRVEGIGNTLVNGRRYQDFAEPTFLDVDLGDGNDWLDIRGRSDNPIFDLNINLGGPTNSGNPDRDILTVNSLNAFLMEVETGGDADQVSFTNSFVGILDVNTGLGNDYVGLSKFSSNEINLNTSAGNDKVNLNSATIPSLGSVYSTIYTGSGEDEVSISNSSLYRYIVVDTGTDADDVSIRNTNFSTLDLETGSGNDDVSIQGGNFWSNASISTSNGVDNVEVEDAYFRLDLNINTGRDQDFIFLDDNTIDDDLRLKTGSHNDVVHIEDTRVRDDLFARLGSGNDQINLVNSRFDWLSVNGESGSDTLELRGRNSFRVFAPSGLEAIRSR